MVTTEWSQIRISSWNIHSVLLPPGPLSPPSVPSPRFQRNSPPLQPLHIPGRLNPRSSTPSKCVTGSKSRKRGRPKPRPFLEIYRNTTTSPVLLNNWPIGSTPIRSTSSKDQRSIKGLAVPTKKSNGAVPAASALSSASNTPQDFQPRVQRHRAAKLPFRLPRPQYLPNPRCCRLRLFAMVGE
jgi:hypothetical protein